MAKRFIQNNFYTFATVSMGASLGAGWMCLSYVQNQQKQRHPLPPASVLGDTSGRIKSKEELRLQAMVENALNSSWKENIDNAFEAQDRFMLPGRDHGGDPKFLKKVDKRAEELAKKQKRRQERRAARAKERGESFYAESMPENELSLDEGKSETKMQFWGSK